MPTDTCFLCAQSKLNLIIFLVAVIAIFFGVHLFWCHLHLCAFCRVVVIIVFAVYCCFHHCHGPRCHDGCWHHRFLAWSSSQSFSVSSFIFVIIIFFSVYCYFYDSHMSSLVFFPVVTIVMIGRKTMLGITHDTDTRSRREEDSVNECALRSGILDRCLPG